jgi:hypothetical protein
MRQAIFTKLLPISICLIAMGTVAHAVEADNLGERHAEKDGGFSLKPPKGWRVAELPGFKYSIIAGPAAKGFAPNINVVDEVFPGKLSEYVAANIKSLEKVFKDYKKVNDSTTRLDSGDTVPCMVITDTQGAILVRQTFYFVNGPKSKGTKLVVTCTCLAEDGDKWDATFERSVKSLEVDK